MNYYDETFVKCPKCHSENIMYARNKRYCVCYKCGFKIKDREYLGYIKRKRDRALKKLTKYVFKYII